jgi:hypothetical protein
MGDYHKEHDPDLALEIRLLVTAALQGRHYHEILLAGDALLIPADGISESPRLSNTRASR